MSKYIQLSRCYFDDKDISDILSNGIFSLRVLLQLARGRGVFISHNEDRKNVISYLSRWGYSWQEILGIASRINSDDREERQSPCRIAGVENIEHVEQVLTETKDDRGPRLEEIYTIQKHGDAKFEVLVTYTEFDPSKQKAFQRREITSRIEFEKVGERIDVRHPQNDRCKEIVNQVKEKLQRLTQKELKTTSIELTGVRDPVKRTAFFLSLTNKIPTFRHIDVIDLKVSNRFPDMNGHQAGEEDDDGVREETEEEAEIKSMVKNAALSGQGLLTSELYTKLRETGYYLTNMVWSARETVGESRLVEFLAGFKEPVEATDFFHDVRKIYPRDDPADKKRTQGELLAAERPRLRRLLETAAYESLAELQSVDSAGEEV